MCLMFKTTCEAHINHIDRHGKDGDGEDFAQERYVQTLEQFSTRERSEEHPDEYRKGEDGHDVAALDVDHRIKLDVVVLTLKGTFMMPSIAITFSTPEPMPKMPESIPARSITANPPPTLVSS